MGIIAVDPGTSNTGLVYMDERRVIDVRTLHYRSTVKDDQYALLERAELIARQFRDWSYDKPHELVVIEGFVCFKGRQNAYTFQTPYLCGFLHDALLHDGERIVIQKSGDVLNPNARGNVSRLVSDMKLGYEVWGDSWKCGNEHLRSALAHGIYYYEQEAKRNGKEVR